MNLKFKLVMALTLGLQRIVPMIPFVAEHACRRMRTPDVDAPSGLVGGYRLRVVAQQAVAMAVAYRLALPARNGHAVGEVNPQRTEVRQVWIPHLGRHERRCHGIMCAEGPRLPPAVGVGHYLREPCSVIGLNVLQARQHEVVGPVVVQRPELARHIPRKHGRMHPVVVHGKASASPLCIPVTLVVEESRLICPPGRKSVLHFAGIPSSSQKSRRMCGAF